MLRRLPFFLTLTACSLPSYGVELSTYIVNGSDISLSEHNDFASLYYDASDYGDSLYEPFCGATLLSSQYVLTAAHCLFDGAGSPDEFTLLFTKVGQVETEDTSAVDGVRAEEFYYYSSFSDSDSDLWANDIAIIKLESPLNTGGEVVVATDQSYRSDSTNSYVTIGLGITSSSDTGASGRTLQSVDMTYVDNTSCAAQFGTYHGPLLTDKQICFAGADNDGNDSTLDGAVCSGDSGGPIYLDDSSGSYVQVGITSFGPDPCGTGDVTSVYTEVADYSTWISNVLAGNITPQFTATDALREAYGDGSSSTTTAESSSDSGSFVSSASSDSSAGSLGWFAGLLLSATLIVRKRFRRQNG